MGQFVEDFSGGFPSSIQRLGDVTSDTFDVNGDRAHSGSASLLSGRPDSAVKFSANYRIATWRPEVLHVPRKLNYLQFWYNETSNSTGHFLAVVDGDGSVIAGYKSRNPEWRVVSDNGVFGADPLAGDDHTYNRWIRVRMDFDWTNQLVSFVIETEDQEFRREFLDELFLSDTLSRWQGPRSGIHGVDFWQGNRGGSGQGIFEDAGPQQVWYDDLLIDGPIALGTISGTVEDEDSGDPIAATVRAFEWSSGAQQGETTSSSADGAFSIDTVIPGNDYAVTVFPGNGGRPRTHGPITAK